MTAQYKRNRFKSSAGMLVKRVSRLALFGIILVLIPFFVFFMMRSNNPDRFTGIVESESETVGSVEASRIVSIEVFPGQKVKPGDVLVHLEPTERTMDIAVNEARLMDYEQSLLRYRENTLQYRQTIQESIRKYRQLMADASVELEQEKMNKARDEAELEGLKGELKRLQPLVDNRLVSETELAGIRPQITALELTVKQYDPLINALRERLEKAREGYQEVLVQQKELESTQPENHYETALKKAREAYSKITAGEPTVLRATKAGIVSRIQHQAGDVVPAGDPIIRITSESSMHVIGLLPQGLHKVLNVGDRLIISRITQPGQDNPLVAEVENLDPEVMDLIDPFNPAPRVPLRGRRVRLRIVSESHNLVPGETVYLHPPGRNNLIDEFKRCFIPDSGIKHQILFTTSSR